MHVVQLNNQIPLSIDDLDCLESFSKFPEKTLKRPQLEMNSSLKEISGHKFIDWNHYTLRFLSTTELQRLHRRFDYPGTDKLVKLLQWSILSDIGPDTRRILEGVEQSHSSYETYVEKQRQFKFSLHDDKDFDHTVYTDIFILKKV